MAVQTPPRKRDRQRTTMSGGAAADASFRAAIYLLALVLGVYSIWLLAAELVRPGMRQLPTDPQSAAIAAERRGAATWAARIGLVRGDLWAQAALSFSDLLWSPANGNLPPATTLDQARDTLVSAVRYAPSRADILLLVAGLASRYRWTSPQATEALRMSYYTGPSELSLMPLRARVAAQIPSPDPDLDQFARSDLRVLLAQRQKSAVLQIYLQIYQSATPAQKRAIEKAVADTEPSLVDALRRGGEGQNRGMND
jgi:hypothetical protein